MFNKLLDTFLSRYNDDPYLIRQKSRVLCIIILIIIILNFLLIITNILRKNNEIGVIAPLVASIIVFIFSLILLKYKLFSITAHLLMFIVMITAWSVMFLEKCNDYLVVFDTIVYIPVLMILLPLIIIRNPIMILFYFIINTIILLIFVKYAGDYYKLSFFVLSDYFIDNMVTIIFVSLMSYQIFIIHKRALDKADEEIELNKKLNLNLEDIIKDRTKKLEEAHNILLNEMELAKKIEFALLPQKIPNINDIDIAYKYIPVMEIGGDFIDIHYREDMKEIGFFICDVSGHGVPAALTASMVKMSLSSWGHYISSPSDHLVHIRNLLYGKMGENFITASICTLDISTGKIISSSAGHPPLIIIRNDGNIELVKSQGRIICDFMEPNFSNISHTLNPGDTLIMYTDGIIETRKNEVMIGYERFIGLINENHSKSSEELCQVIYDFLNDCVDNKGFDDDVTLLVIKYGTNK